MGQEAGPFHMAEEIDPEPLVLMGSLDEPRHVGDDDFLIVHGENSEVGGQGCEGVSRNFRPGVGDGGEDARLAGIRHADKADIGDELELEKEVPLLPLVPFFGKAGGFPN